MKRKKKLRLKLRAERRQWVLQRGIFERTLETLEQRIAGMQDQLREYETKEQRQIQQAKVDWSLYDKAQAEVTAQELALFQASPAYKKYQKYRAQRGEKAS